MRCFVITANRTLDGGVVYLTADQGWTVDIGGALTVADKPSAAPHIAWARTQQAFVCDPYALKALRAADGIVPVGAKEAIRAAGPQATLKALGLIDPAPAEVLPQVDTPLIAAER